MLKKLKKILIIEDDLITREALELKLNGAGFLTIVSTTGIGGFKKAKNEKPDIILLDIILPDFKEFEVLKKFKKSHFTKKIPVIILTNLGQDKDIKTGLELGADAYLVKASLTLNNIVAKIKNIVGEP